MGDFSFGLQSTRSRSPTYVSSSSSSSSSSSTSPLTSESKRVSSPHPPLPGVALFFPSPTPHAMQDELLMDRSTAAQSQQLQQQLSPRSEQGVVETSDATSTEATLAAISCAISSTSAAAANANVSAPGGGGRDPVATGCCSGSSSSSSNSNSSLPMESPLLPSLAAFQEPPLSAGFGAWSTGVSGAPGDESIFPGLSSINGTVLFPPNIGPMFGPGFSPQISLPPQATQGHQHAPPPPPPVPAHQQQHHPQQRRSPVPLQAPFPQRNVGYGHHQPIMTSKPSAWGGAHHPQPWGSAGWGAAQSRGDPRRAAGLGIPTPMNPISPLKKQHFPGNSAIGPPKYARSPMAPQKSWLDESAYRGDPNSLLAFPERGRPFDPLSMQALESSLLDIMQGEHDQLKGTPRPTNGAALSAAADMVWRSQFASRLGIGYPHPGMDNLLSLNGRSSLFPLEDGFLDDGHGDQSAASSLSSPSRCSPRSQNGEHGERYSRKVFVGGLPPDIDEDEITASFRRFGLLVVDWPHKAESKSYFPPKGYAFLLFQEENSVQALIDACIKEDDKLYLCVSSPTIKDKPVQIRPWNLSDSDFVMDGSQPLDPRKTIFVGGVPRPLRAVELAMIMDRLYGGVCYAGIDTDPELKYPKGAGRVAFSNQQSYIAAISARFVQLQHGDIDKRVEVKPYVLDDQMCDECQGARCGGKFAPFFCANVTCLQYYCEHCWASIHSRAGREFHKPLVKEGADRPRHISYRWC
uniref:cytoplasmic polyadenylation element-binding protein 2-like isoform X2 n=1 Tax=Myxine glutinosa TaxID=7769 RepID=UPI003590087F